MNTAGNFLLHTGQTDTGVDAARHGDFNPGLAIGLFPLAGGQTVGSLVAAGSPVQTAVDIGGKLDVVPAGTQVIQAADVTVDSAAHSAQ